MTKRKSIIIISAIAAVVIIAAVIVILILSNGSAEGYDSITVTEIAGEVTVENKGDTYKAYTNMKLTAGFTMTTAAESHSYMSLDDEKYVRLDEESRAKFEALGSGGRSTAINLEYGQLSSEIIRPLRAGEGYAVTTPNAVLSVRGTLFITKSRKGTDGKWLTDVYTFGGSVSSRRIMPDGTPVDEDVRINAGYKATIRMDDDTTYYIQESTDQPDDNVDPIGISDIDTDILAFVYAAADGGHDVCFTQTEILEEFAKRGADITQYNSYRTGKPLAPPAEPKAQEVTGETQDSPDNGESGVPEEIPGEEETSDSEEGDSNTDAPPQIPTDPDSNGNGGEATDPPSGTTAAPDTTVPPAGPENKGGEVTTAPDNTLLPAAGDDETVPDEGNPEEEPPADTTLEAETTAGDGDGGEEPPADEDDSGASPADEDDSEDPPADNEGGEQETTAATTATPEETTAGESEPASEVTTKDYTIPDTPPPYNVTTSGSGTVPPELCDHSYSLKNVVLVSGAGSSAVFSAYLKCPVCGDSVSLSAPAAGYTENPDGSVTYRVIFTYNGSSYFGTYTADSGTVPCSHIYGLRSITHKSGSGSSAVFVGTLMCSNCSDTVTVTGTVTNFAAIAGGGMKYFIDFTYNGETWSDTYIDEGSIVCIHDYDIAYGEVEYYEFIWNSDHSSCTAKFYCKKGCGAFETVACTVDPPYVTAEGTVYTAWCEFGEETFSDSYTDTAGETWYVPEFYFDTGAGMDLSFKWGTGEELYDFGTDNTGYYAEIYVWYGGSLPDPYSISDCWIATVPYVAEESITSDTNQYVTLSGGFYSGSLYPAFSGTVPPLATGDTVTLGIEVYSPSGTLARRMPVSEFTVN